MKKITAKEYWNTYLPKALLETGYLPEQFYYLITTSKELQEYITEDIIRNWYKEDDNLKNTVHEILYVSGINDTSFTQSCNINNLICAIHTAFDIKVVDDKTVIIWNE
jgi:hypothetical protein